MIPRKRRKKGTSKGMLAVQKRGAAESILRGHMLVIDPASGGGESVPGYAVFSAGELIESGTIDVGGPQADLHDRLFELGITLRDSLPNKVDVLVIEDVPLKRFGPDRSGSLKGQVNLHRSVGAVMGAVKCRFFIPVHPATWHSHAGPDHVKSDENDAIAMGRCALSMASETLGRRVARRRSRKKD
jgi:hypothetical protein